MANHLNPDTATLEGGKGAWTNWFSTDGGVRVTDQAFEGVASLKATVTTAGSWGLTFNNWPGFPATPGDKTIRLRARQGVGITSGTFRVKWRDSSNADVLISEFALSALDATWKQFTATATAPAGTTTCYVEFQGTGAALNDSLYIDDIYVGDVEGPPATTATRSPSTNVGVVGTWTNPANAYSDDNSYATASPGKNGSITHEFAGFDFGSVIPEGATIGTVTVRQRWFVSTTGSIATLGSQAFVGTTAQGTEFTTTAEPLTETLDTYTVSGLTRADLLDLRVRIRAHRANTNTTYVASLDAVDVVAEYVAGTQASSGTASVTGGGSVTATGSKQAQSVAASSGAGSVSAVGRKNGTTSTTVVGTGTVTVTGGIVAPSVTGSASVTGTGQVSASGSRTATSSVSVAGGSQVGVEASRGAQTASSVTGSGAVLATGSKHVFCTVSVTGTGVVTASGRAEVPSVGSGVVLVTGTGSVSVAAGKNVTRSSTVSGSGSVTAAGSKQVSRSVSVSGTGQVSTSGTAEQVSAGTVSVSGTGSVVVVGTKSYAVSPSVSGTGSVSVQSLASRGGTASVSALGLITVEAGSLRPVPVAASVHLASARAAVVFLREEANVSASKPSARTSSSAPSSA